MFKKKLHQTATFFHSFVFSFPQNIAHKLLTQIKPEIFWEGAKEGDIFKEKIPKTKQKDINKIPVSL